MPDAQCPISNYQLPVKQRLDVLLVEKGLSSSRQQAQRLIQAGEVLVNDNLVDKPGTDIDVAAEIRVKQKSRFVSRGGEKLKKALDNFDISVEGRVCLDGGISTGGFTDCLLQSGAKLVYGIDVGYGQVDWRLRNDARVVLRERTNLRHLTPEDLYGFGEQETKKNKNSQNNHQKNLPPLSGIKEVYEREFPDLAVVDVSFISLTKVLPALWKLLQSPREALLLVKPQFEVGKNRVGKKGVVRNPNDQADAIFQVLQTATELGWCYKGLTWSPITGPAGNIEYLLWLESNLQTSSPDLPAIKQITSDAAGSFKQS
ncbi:hemolysin A [Rivularia sp. PCC 7116]|uniref:TlyA family RNA methyltransferase n=1 Tax=Rivularia sp. PCC 7116 TaxID=373994 RepID=UPI00029EE107|nr:TlyA family RNA methyltransferase [Rivularia sp. PCC 7116]AFY55749.1 hemolysin A [Rivularia sp. PCC 7116]